MTRITALARVGPQDVVLEVGPGFGSLTLPLLDAAGRVLAVEIDQALAAQLPLTVADRAPGLAGKLHVVTADAARVTGLPGPPPTALVANLPYNVAVPVVLHLFATVPSISRALVMVQAEVADRMCAPPGSRTYGVPSAKLAWFGTARRAGSVPRAVFWPVPRVDSGLVELIRREPGGPRLAALPLMAPGPDGPGPDGPGPDGPAPGGGPAVTREATFAVIDAAFSQRRKTLRSALANWAGSAAAAEEILRLADVDPALRGEALGIAEFARIAAAGQLRTRA